MRGRNTTVVSARLPDDVAEGLKILARKRRRTMSALLADIALNYVSRKYSPGRPRRGKVGLPGKVASPMPEVAVIGDFHSLEVADVVSPVSLKALGREMVSPLLEDTVQKVLELKGHHPCLCGSGLKYRDCCRSKRL